jgi:hypothetical protein
MRRAALLIALAAVLAGCGSPAPQVRTHVRVVPVHVLAHGSSQRALRWFAHLRDCYRRRELRPGRIVLTTHRLTVVVDPSVPESVLAGEMLACVSRLGKPPAHASFRTRRDRTVLLPPKGYVFARP